METLYSNKSFNTIDNDKSLGYSTSTMKKYWCHLCKKDFKKLYIPNIDIQCKLLWKYIL